MPQSTQGLIIGLLLSLLIGMVIGFYLRQSRVSRLASALQESQDRQAALQQEHEARLRAATAQLQKDYESQLAEKIERYQSQYEQQLQQLEAEYQGRLGLVTEGIEAGFDPANPGAIAPEGIGSLPASEFEQRLRQQYEARLKEAAYKIQQAYEQHLRDTLTAARDAQQREFDQRLAEAIAHYQDEAETRLEEALRDRELQAVALVPEAGNDGAEPPILEDARLQERLATLEIDLRAEYDRRLAERIEQYQDEMTQRTAQLEQEFAARLQMAQATQPETLPPEPNPLAVAATTDIEMRLQAEYDQRLAEAIARHQDELEERSQALEAELAARLQMAQAADLGVASGVGVTSDLEASLRRDLEAQLRLEYDQRLAEQLEQYQAELNQRTQEMEAGLADQLAMGFRSENSLADPFEDGAMAAESLEEGSLDLDPFPELATSDPLESSALDLEEMASESGTTWAMEGLDVSETPFTEDAPPEALPDDPFDLDDLDLADVDQSDATPSPDLADNFDLVEGSPAELEAAFNLDDLDLSASMLDEGMITADEEPFGLDLATEAPGLADENAFALDLAEDDTGFDADALDALLNSPDQQGQLDDDLLDDLDGLGQMS